MLKAGRCLCRHCGRVSKELFYYSGTDNCGVFVKRLPFGKSEVELYVPEGMSAPSVKVSLVPGENSFRKNINPAISVYVEGTDGEKRRTMFSRYCPRCFEKGENMQKMEPADIGLRPAYVIAVIGKSGSGKSSWLYSLSNLENAKMLRKCGYPYAIIPHQISRNDERIVRTPLGEIGMTCALNIVSSEKNQKVADVMLIDLAGELFEKKNKAVFESSAVYQIFRGTEEFGQVDAVVFIDDASVDGDEVDLYNRITELGLLNDRPVAYVLNKIDALFEGSDGKPPILTEKTFPKTNRASMEKDAFAARIALENQIVHQSQSVSEQISENGISAGFAVKSCAPPERIPVAIAAETEDKQDPAEQSDFINSINVYDPLVWILNQLGTFPIGKE